MLTITVKPNVSSSYIKWYPESIEDPSELFTSINEDSYFYISGGSLDKMASEELVFNIPEKNMSLIPSNAIIESINITFRTQKENDYGVFDNILLKYNGQSIANIDGTSHSHEIKTTEFKAEKLNDLDIYKEMLSDGNFQIVMQTEGPKKFKLLYILFQISYTEVMHSSVCKLMTKKGLITLPLYNPVNLSRYALRIMTQAGIKAFDLTNIDNKLASPIRVMTSSGLMAVRRMEASELDNTVLRYSWICETETGNLLEFKVDLEGKLKWQQIKPEEDEVLPIITKWYVFNKQTSKKFLIKVSDDGEMRTEPATATNIVEQVYRIKNSNNCIFELTVTDDGILEIIKIDTESINK